MNKEDVGLKLCHTCLQEKTLDEFYFRKKDNRYESQCKQCRKEYKKEYYGKNKLETIKKQHEYYLNNKSKRLEYAKRYRKLHSEKYAHYNKEYYLNNKVILSEKNKEYYIKNKDKIVLKTADYFEQNKVKIYKHRKNRFYNDEIYAFKTRTRKIISNAFHDVRFRQYKQLENIVGCKYEEFIIYLKETFRKNYGIKVEEYDGPIDIDHKIPLNKANSKREIILLNHYSNLQLLKREDNRKKGVELEYEI